MQTWSMAAVSVCAWEQMCGFCHHQKVSTQPFRPITRRGLIKEGQLTACSRRGGGSLVQHDGVVNVFPWDGASTIATASPLVVHVIGLGTKESRLQNKSCLCTLTCKYRKLAAQFQQAAISMASRLHWSVLEKVPLIEQGVYSLESVFGGG